MPAARILNPTAFDTDDFVNGVRNIEIPVDASRGEALVLRLTLTSIALTASDALKAYLQTRGPDGLWDDRIALATVAGNVTASAAAPVAREGVVQKFGTLESTAEVYTPSGSADGDRLGAGTVRNGPFPPPYHGPESGEDRANARVRLELTDDSEAAQFVGTVAVYRDAAD